MDLPFHPLLIVGVVLLLLGWLAIPLAVTLLGGFVGMLGGVLLVDLIITYFPAAQIPEWGYPVSAVILGVLGAIVARKLLYWLIFVAGVFGTLALKAQLDSTYGLSEELVRSLGGFAGTPWFTLIVGLLGGALLALLRRYVLVVLSALVGAVLIARTAGLEEKMLILVLVGIGFQTLCVVFRPRKPVIRGGE